ncbi:MAG: hypothetical protein FE78DRAFT_91103 [Acidomyces sp. 'richmondensis']|nr:MAG: hypothetical protein FE78DRAFT_91103 [Acidomyces sp. 'richmondensis']
MASPPSYEEIASEHRKIFADGRDPKTPQRFSIREEVDASRERHVAAIVTKLVPLIRGRAKSGLSKSKLILFPSDQECSRKGELIGFSDAEIPIIIQLESRHDTTEFWMQKEALGQLQDKILAAILDISPPPMPERLQPKRDSLPNKPSFFGRKKDRVLGQNSNLQPSKATVIVEVKQDEIYFRKQSEFGLLETGAGNVVVLSIDVQ